MTGHAATARLLLSLFTADELRRFLRAGPDGDELAAALPGGAADDATLADGAVLALRARGALDDAFFARLVEERPLRADDIEAVRVLVGVGPTNRPFVRPPRPAAAVPLPDVRVLIGVAIGAGGCGVFLPAQAGIALKVAAAALLLWFLTTAIAGAGPRGAVWLRTLGMMLATGFMAAVAFGAAGVATEAIVSRGAGPTTRATSVVPGERRSAPPTLPNSTNVEPVSSVADTGPTVIGVPPSVPRDPSPPAESGDAPAPVPAPAESLAPASSEDAAPAWTPSAWARSVGLAVGSPEEHDARLRALRAMMTASGEDDDRRVSLRDLSKLLVDMDEGEPLPREDRVAVLARTVDEGQEAGRLAWREAEARAEQDPAVLAGKARLVALLDAILESGSNDDARALVERARATPVAAGGLSPAQAAVALRVIDLLPEVDRSARARGRPLLERAFTRRSGQRAALIDLLSSFDIQLELVHLGVRSAATVIAENEMEVVDAYWYACASEDQRPVWRVVHDDVRPGPRTAREMSAEVCGTDYPNFSAGWTVTLGGEPVTHADDLRRTLAASLVTTCVAPSVTIGMSMVPGGGTMINGTFIPGAMQAVPITERAPARPPDCTTRETARARIVEINAALNTMVSAATAPSWASKL